MAAVRPGMSTHFWERFGSAALILIFALGPRFAVDDETDEDVAVQGALATWTASAEGATALGHLHRLTPELAVFLLLPFGHSERLEDQKRSVTLAEALRPEEADHARHHRDVIRRFGRFPHRNAILGRATTLEEATYLAGGYAG